MSDKMEVETTESWSEQRIKKLGFKPQKEIFHNFHLPTSSQDLLDDESTLLLNSIKNSLGLAVANREIYPTTGIYVSKLMK
jgi:hypothetical protein